MQEEKEVITVAVTICGKQVKKFIAEKMKFEYELNEFISEIKSYNHTGKQKCIFENVIMVTI